MNRAFREVLVLALLFPPQASAQAAGSGVAGHSWERQERARWLHERQLPEFTPFATSHRWFHIDSVVPRQGWQTLYLSFDRPGSGTGAALTVDASGRMSRADSWQPPPPEFRTESPGDSARYERALLMESGYGNRLALPAAPLWDFVPGFPPLRPGPGVRWVDTLDLVAARNGFRQAIQGVRVSTITRGTVIAGRRLWLVRDSAHVHYTLYLMKTADGWVEVDRDVWIS